MQHAIYIVGWILWVLVAFVALFALLISLLPGDPGGRWVFRVQGLIWAVGVAVTGIISFSKFHLLWIVPVGALAPFAIMNWRAQRRLNTLLARKQESKVSPAVMRDAFTAARSRYEESQQMISSYTSLARSRAAIARARIRYDETKDSQAYEKEVATFTDPAAFAPYTERELDDYAIRIERLAGDFEAFGTAFATLESTTVDPDDDFYLDSAASFNFYCETFKAAVDAYKITALAAQLTAAQMKAQAAHNHAKAWIFEQVGDDADENQRKVAGAKAAPLKAMAAEEETTAERLEQKAKAAETRAKLLLSKVGAN